MEFKKVLIFKDDSQIDREIRQLETHRKFFQKIVDNVQNLSIEVQGNEIVELFENPKAFTTDKLTKGEKMQVGGLKLNKEKLFDLIEKPDGLQEVIAEILLANNDGSPLHWHLKHLNSFFVENGIVVTNPEYLQDLEREYSIFATTENQVKGFEKLTQIAKLVNEVNVLAHGRLSIDERLGEILERTENELKANPNNVSWFK
ncbi:hypothetical protein [Flavobacterium sp.]|uniref:hypothetical protein n=1 Tax=Flavobacterium sp. TaxID=239 RepID=UPI003752E352